MKINRQIDGKVHTMAIGNYNAAYDLSLFDESLNASSAVPKRRADGEAHQQNRKRQNRRNQVMKLPEEELNKIRRRKRNPLQIAMGATGAAVVTFVIGIIIAESLYVQNQMKVEAAHTNAEIEKYATEVLGMSKASNAQKEFIALETDDKAEVSSQKDSNIFTRFFDSLSNLWS